MTDIFSKNFEPPTPLAGSRWILSVLCPLVVDEDYRVVMNNKERLRSVFTKEDDWPTDTMTLADNLADLQMHKREYDQRDAYAYVIHTPSGEYVGCAYIYPPSVSGYDAELFFWVDRPFITDEPQLSDVLKHWLKTSWAVTKVALPGRDQPWSAWSGSLFHAS